MAPAQCQIVISNESAGQRILYKGRFPAEFIQCRSCAIWYIFSRMWHLFRGFDALHFRCEPADHVSRWRCHIFCPCVCLTAARVLSPVHRSPWRRAGSYTSGQRAIFSPVRAHQPQRWQQNLNLRPSIGQPVYDRSRRRMPTIRGAQRTAPSASKTEPCIQITAAVPIGRLSITQLL